MVIYSSQETWNIEYGTLNQSQTDIFSTVFGYL